MKFIRIKSLGKEIVYQSNQLLSIERFGDKVWQLTFTDKKQYIIRGPEYINDFNFIEYADIYDLEDC